jgi:DNA polymerase-4
MVKTFLNPLSIQKIPMVGDVTFQLLSRIGIRTIQTLSEMPAEVLQQMIGKTVLISGKKQMVLTTIQ